MTFGMRVVASQAIDHVDHDEEYLLWFGDEARPQLARLARDFYDSPTFEADDVTALAAELDAIVSTLERSGTTAWRSDAPGPPTEANVEHALRSFRRWRAFFQAAARLRSPVETDSD